MRRTLKLLNSFIERHCQGNRCLVMGLMICILLAGSVGTWWLVVRAEREMSEDLLGRTRLAAKTVNLEKIKALTGTADDVDSVDYQQLKEQFIDIRAADPNCRYVYLMGRKANGTVFFFLDSEPENSRDYFPPGDVYEEVSEGDLRVFETGIASVFGPVTDRWGMWISSLVPMTDPKTGEIIALMGMDIDARDWRWNVAARAGWSVGMILLMMIGLLTALFAAGKVPSTPKPVMRRLLPFLTVMLLVLVLASAFILWRGHYDRLIGRTATVSTDVEWGLKTALERQARGLAMSALSIAVDSRVQDALKAKDAELIPIDYDKMFETLQQEQSLTHFLFLDKERICLKRLHKPDLVGGKIERLAAQEAERTGKASWGIDKGLAGKASLRSFQPVFDDQQTLVGYIELGTEIDRILRELQIPDGVEIALSIRKDAMRQVDWQEGMPQVSPMDDCERLPNSVIVYESKGRLPDVFAQLLDHNPSEDHYNQPLWNIVVAGKNWNVTVSPLADSSGREVGNILIVNDITSLKASFRRDITLGGIISAVILAALLGLSYVVLRHTDAGIRAQEEKLRDSREHLAATLRSIGDGVIACNTAGTVVSLNAAAEELTGWSNAEAAGVSIREVFRIINAMSREPAEIPVFRAISDGTNVDLANHTALIAKDGTERQIADSCAPIKDASGTVSGAVLVFRDVTEEYRQREELRESEERFKQLAAQSRTITWEFTSEGLYTFISPVVKNILGYTPQEIIGKMHFYDLHPEGEHEEIKKTAFGYFTRKEHFQELVRPALTKSGEIRWLSTNGIPLLNPDGTLRGYRGSYTDITERRQMEAELTSERTRLAGIIEATHVGTWEWNVQTGATVFNERWAEIIGYTLEEISPATIETWMKYTHPDDLKRCNEMLEKHFRGELLYYDVEVRMRHKNGEWVWVHDRGKVVSRTREGKPLLMLGTHQDITERKRMETELEKERTRLAGIIEATHAGTWEWNVQTGETVLNERWAEIIGYTLEEISPISSKIWKKYCHPDDLKQASERIEKHFRGELPYHDVEVRMQHKNGEWVWVNDRGRVVSWTQDGKPLLMRGTHQDITDRKRIENELLTANERYELAVSGVNDGIWDWNITTNELYLSPRWKQILGYENHELENHHDTFIRLTYEEDLGRVNEHLQSYFKGETNEYSVQFRMKHKDGSLRWILSKGAAIRDKENRPFRMAGSHSDITLQKMAEEAIKVAKNQAEAATKAKSVFLANMSHEIRTPLNGVIGFTDLLRNTQLTNEQRLYAENASVSAHSLLNIISDILDFSKIEAGMLTLEYIMTDMFQLFEQSMDIVKFNAEKKELEILLDLDVDMPRFAMVDPVRLNQVLVNLLGNAVKFTSQGEVELKVRYKPQVNNRGVFSISVRDTGIGISKEQQQKLFKAFTQADPSTTRKFGGTGLGLTISDMIVSQMGSKIQIESVEGKGATFFFELSLDTAKGEIRSHEVISRIKRCLVIDDNANNRLILEHMLKSWDIECESCADGLSALEILSKSKPFDIIICDYNMPKIDGLETIRRIREKMETTPEKQPMILLYSSSEDPDIHKRSLELGVCFCIAKPVKQEQLFACFASAMESKKLDASAGAPETVQKPEAETAAKDIPAGPVILVAEDVHMNMMLVKVLLSKIFPGSVIHEAGTGLAAIHKYREFHPDLILMDLQMPEMDGREATQEIRKLERDTGSGKRVPIIALSAEAQPEEMESSIKAGIDDYVTKPIETKKLKAVLEKHLRSERKA
ncbi:MAG: PAS domain S-box protein [Verrucomicrobiae bacterium]|nr:PAS domain S-box protein [Verrucomicrobiae bacterium]